MSWKVQIVVFQLLLKTNRFLFLEIREISSNFSKFFLSDTDRVSSCFFINERSRDQIFVFSRQKWRSSETTECIKSQLHALRHRFQENEIELSSLNILCFLCVDEHQNADSEKLEKALQKTFVNVCQTFKLPSCFGNLDYQKVIYNSKTEEFYPESSVLLKQKVELANQNDTTAQLMENVMKFAADPFKIRQKTGPYQYTDSVPVQEITLDKQGIHDFLGRYLRERNEKLITLPDFDRIKATKLYPVMSSRNTRAGNSNEENGNSQM